MKLFEGNVFTDVCLSTWGRAERVGQPPLPEADSPPPGSIPPSPRRQTPLAGRPYGGRPPPEKDMEPEGRPPMVLTSSGNHRSGRYASYSNAYLFGLFSFSFLCVYTIFWNYNVELMFKFGCPKMSLYYKACP